MNSGAGLLTSCLCCYVLQTTVAVGFMVVHGGGHASLESCDGE